MYYSHRYQDKFIFKIIFTLLLQCCGTYLATYNIYLGISVHFIVNLTTILFCKLQNNIVCIIF